MATKRKSGYSSGANKLLSKADKYLRKGEAPFGRVKQANKAGINTKLDATEYSNLERAISKSKRKK